MHSIGDTNDTCVKLRRLMVIICSTIYSGISRPWRYWYRHVGIDGKYRGIVGIAQHYCSARIRIKRAFLSVSSKLRVRTIQSYKNTVKLKARIFALFSKLVFVCRREKSTHAACSSPELQCEYTPLEWKSILSWFRDFVAVIPLQTGGDVAVPERQCSGVGGDVLERGWGGDGGEGRSTDERRWTGSDQRRQPTRSVCHLSTQHLTHRTLQDRLHASLHQPRLLVCVWRQLSQR